MSEEEKGAFVVPPTRHRADDDVEALASGAFMAATTTSTSASASASASDHAVDLLSGEAASVLDATATNPTPFSIGGDDDDDDEDDDDDGDDDGGDEDISAPFSKKDSTDSAIDDGSGTPVGGTQGKQLAKLSDKTTKIMSDYQAYLSEIETEFPPDADEGRGNNNDPALVRVGAAREGIRDAHRLLDGGGVGDDPLPPINENDGYITNTTTANNGGENLARSWYYGRSPTSGVGGIHIDRTGGGGGGGGTGGDYKIGDYISDYDDEDFERGMLMKSGSGQHLGYTSHPWLRSRRFRRGVATIVGMALIVGLSTALAKGNRKNKELDALMDEKNWSSSDKGGVGSGASGGGGGGGGDEEGWPPSSPSVITMNDLEIEQLYERAVDTYKPMTFDRSRGWTGTTYAEALAHCSAVAGYAVCPYDAICPGGGDAGPMGGHRQNPESDWSWVPIIDSMNDWVQVGSADSCIRYSYMHGDSPDWGITPGKDNEAGTQNLMCCLGEDLVNAASYDSAMEKYSPKEFDRNHGWRGRTFAEAVDFCKNVNVDDEDEGGKYGLCPYAGLCPLGPDNEPLVGYKDGEEAWIPVLDGVNEWVQAGADNTCVAYSHEHPTGPGWGVSGEDNEALTRNVVCCRLDQQPATFGWAESMMYQLAMASYRPRVFDRSNGWQGRTYGSALEFCEALGGGGQYELCPYDAVCPLGNDREPSMSYAKEPSQWVPIIDKANDWVQISRDDTCIKYSAMFPDAPEWGYEGKGDEAVTRHVMCCAVSGFNHPLEPAPTLEVAKVQADELNDVVPENKDTILYKQAVTKYQPHVFDRSNGWGGTSFGAALEFCDSLEGGGKYQLCPYDAVCPLGQDSEPVMAYAEEESQWVPIVDKANDWVQISRDLSCIKYSAMFPDAPDWGYTGLGDEEITRNVLCCAIQEQEKPPIEAPPSGPSVADAKVEVKSYMTGAEDAEVYEQAMSTHHPHMFDRSSGWKGQSFGVALEFCEALDSGGAFQLCSYDAVCPLGPDSEPIMSYSEEESQWVPIIDKANEWVQISRDDSCIKYSGMFPDAPEWGYKGIGDEAVTRYVLCCAANEKKPPPIDPPPTEQSISEAKVQVKGETWEEKDLLVYEEAMSKYHPHMFDRSNGWKGQSFGAALEFCDALDSGGAFQLCSYDAICPHGTNNDPIVPYAEEKSQWVPIIDKVNDWVQISRDDGCIKYSAMFPDSPNWGYNGMGDEAVTRYVLCCSMESNPPLSVSGHYADDTIVYRDIATVYQPKWYGRTKGWTGQTYLEAIQFCNAVTDDGSYELCPLFAICPLGDDSEPLGGYREEPNGSWVPVIDNENEWVQVSSDNSCIQYDHINADHAPEWGLTGVGAEEMTRHVACCLVQDVKPLAASSPEIVITPTSTTIAPEVAHQEYFIMAEKYRPQWHDRSKGWTGRTYLEAVQFCGTSNNDLYDLCPLEAICPLGPDTEPLGGFKDDELGAWVPITDDANEWVQVSGLGPGGTCVRYTADHPTKPEWGLTGEESEEITRHVVCCLVQTADSHDTVMSVSGTPPAIAETTAANTVAATLDSSSGVSGEEMSMVYKTVSETFKPKWFDRTMGWLGQTHNDAFNFCSDFNGYFPCPYEAICPFGKGSTPLGGFKNEGPSGTWAPIMNGANEWVQIGEKVDGGSAPCWRYTHLHPAPPSWGNIGEGNEEITRHIACCLIEEPTANPTPLPTEPPTPKPTLEPTPLPTPKPSSKPTYGDDYYYEKIAKSLEPKWFDRTSGWHGQTYLEGLQFCAREDSRVPCPYLAYCPIGMKGPPLGEAKEGVSWAPIMDAPNAWVQVGEEETCELYTDLYGTPPAWGLTGSDSYDLTEHIMCCLEEPPEALPEEPHEPLMLTETEQAVLDIYKAQWYGRDEGYRGGTYTESAKFCNHIAGMDMCPLNAYCPNGPVNEHVGKPLYLQLEAFEGEQWAPVKTDDGLDDVYLLIGTLNDNPTTTCHTYRHFHDGQLPQWGLDGSRPDLKEYILCCKDPNYISNGLDSAAVDLSTGGPEIPAEKLDSANFDLETEIANNLDAEWLDMTNGWTGGSHKDAEDFCASIGKHICPYAAYCPHGPGQPVSKGHSTDINAEGVQWAPVFGQENHWVMVGQKHGNSATTCFGHEDLEGGPPDWGETRERHEIKEHIMCCTLNR